MVIFTFFSKFVVKVPGSVLGNLDLNSSLVWDLYLGALNLTHICLCTQVPNYNTLKNPFWLISVLNLISMTIIDALHVSWVIGIESGPKWLVLARSVQKWLVLYLIYLSKKQHCKPKPCIAYRETLWVNSHREKPAFITGPLFSLQGFPCISL